MGDKRFERLPSKDIVVKDFTVPSRELSALVAEQVMNAQWVRFYDASYADPDSHGHKIHASLMVGNDLKNFIEPNEHGVCKYVLDTGEANRDHLSWVPDYSGEYARQREDEPERNRELGVGKAFDVLLKARITLVPPDHRGYWRAAYCNWETSGNISAVGMTNARKWLRANTPCVAICLAALDSVLYPLPTEVYSD